MKKSNFKKSVMTSLQWRCHNYVTEKRHENNITIFFLFWDPHQSFCLRQCTYPTFPISVVRNFSFGGGATASEGWSCGETPRRPNSRATPQGLDQRSKIEEVVPKMARQRGSDAGQSRRKWVQGRNQDFAKGELENGKNCDVILMTYFCWRNLMTSPKRRYNWYS